MSKTTGNKHLANRGRVVVAKVGLDGHDRGARLLARLLRDEGFEVVYVGVRHSPEQVAQIAQEQEVDVIALSLLSGAHVELSLATRKAMDGLNLQHIPIVLGGLIPKADIPTLIAQGVAQAFPPEETDDIARVVLAIDDLVEQSRAALLLDQ